MNRLFKHIRPRMILMALTVLTVGFASHALAADGFVPLAPIPGLTDTGTTGSVIDSGTLANFFNNLYKYLIGVAASLAVIEIIWGGILYSTTDSVGNKEEGKEKIKMAIFGLILILSPVLVFTIINPSILNLSLNLKPIQNLSTPAPSSGTTTNAYTSVDNMTAEQLKDQSSNGSSGATFTTSSGSEQTITW